VLYPTRFPTFKAPTNFLPEARFNAAFRQPGFLEPRTGFFTRLDGSIAPVILSPDSTSGVVLGYRDIRLSTGVDRSFNSLRLYASFSPTIQFDSPFAYLGQKLAELQSIVIFYPEAVLTFDLRDQQVHPHSGLYVTTDWQKAGFVGDANDFKTQDEIRAYLPLSRKWTLASRVRIGVLIPSNYGQTIEQTANGNPPPLSVQSVKDTQLMFLRGFFAGGLGSNRGYALREIGPHGVVQQGSSTLAKCATGSSSSKDCDLPLGGFTLWEVSLELRYPISGALSGAVFTDTADVSDKQVNFRPRPHLASGFATTHPSARSAWTPGTGYRACRRRKTPSMRASQPPSSANRSRSRSASGRRSDGERKPDG
jgi:outer membrane protein insertion porin family/translocation and assembly module TamA